MPIPTLFLLPNVINPEGPHTPYLPESVEQAVASLDGLIAESEKGARAFLRRFTLKKPLQEMPIRLLNEHTQEKEVQELLAPILKGQLWGYVSDCGLSCLADPGAYLVYLARQKGVHVEVFAGPSAILFAILLSGLPAQSFSFHGYLEKESSLLQKKLFKLQERSKEERSTQVFIETPYRNKKMLETLLKTLHDNTRLCVAWDLTMPTQEVVTLPIKTWRAKALPDIDKKPAVFLFCA